MIAAPGKGGIHADDRVGNGGISGRSKKPEKCKSRSGSGAESAGTGTIAEPGERKYGAMTTLKIRIPAEIEKTGKKTRRGRQFCLPRLLAAGCGLYRRRAHLLAAQGGMTYTPPSIYEIRRNSNDFSEKIFLLGA